MGALFSDGAYYNSIASALKSQFGRRMVKVSIDGGFTCPNRDGSIATGGCIFCSESGSGDFTNPGTITRQIDAQIELLKGKWSDFGCIAYFQNFTGTYADVEYLRELYEEALAHPMVEGLAIATRPDCISSDVLMYLKELNARTFLWVELGLQTADDVTADYINRGYPLKVYDKCVKMLSAFDIRVVTHLIIGLPGETREDIKASVKHVTEAGIYGIKLQLLHIMDGTRLGELYLKQLEAERDSGQVFDNECEESVSLSFYNGCEESADVLFDKGEEKYKLSTAETSRNIRPLSKEEYVSIVADCLELIPPEVTIHRITGDAPGDRLIAPMWSRDKKSVINAVNMELKNRGTHQGSRSLPTMLLHSCCGPCSTAVIERLVERYDLTVYFYNPNITNEGEYYKRLETERRFINDYNRSLAGGRSVKLIAGPYDPDTYLDAVRGLEELPENSDRCSVCFRVRMTKTAEEAERMGFENFTTTLSVSPHKNTQRINEIGHELDEKYAPAFLDESFKKKDGFRRSVELSEEYGLYRQSYCGCVFSERPGCGAENPALEHGPRKN